MRAFGTSRIFLLALAVLACGLAGPGFAAPSVVAGTAVMETPIMSISSNSTGATLGVVFKSWGTESGLPQNTVNAIVQSRDGYLWLGTRDGLVRFDGVRFTVFGLRDGLPSIEVQSLYQDRRGTLWIGTSGGGLCRLDGGRITVVPLPSGSGDVVNSFAEDSAGRLWIGTPAGLSVLLEGRFLSLDALARVQGAGIRTILNDGHGSIWIATMQQGLFQYRDNTLEESVGPTGQEKISAYCLESDQNGRLWASVGNGTVLCRTKGRWLGYNQDDGLPFAYVSCLAEEADGTIWAGSLDSGLYRFDGSRFRAVRKEDGLSANDIRSLLPDREGNLWVGTRTGGLNRLSRRKLATWGAAQGLTNDYTRSVAESPDGTFWVATTGGGLYRNSPNGLYPVAPFYAFAESVLALRSGDVWGGTSHALLHFENNQLTQEFTNQAWLKEGTVTALCPDAAGGFWIGTSQSRLIHFQDGKFIESKQRVARGAVTALARLPNGLLWIGSMAGGLKGIQEGKEEVLSVTNGLLSQSIRTLYLDTEGTLWIGTAGGGLARFRDGQIFNFTRDQGVEADTVVQIVEDGGGSLWLGSSRGILRVSRKDLNNLAAGKISHLHSPVYGIADGMPSEECSSGFCPAGLKTRSGLLCFSTVKGLVFLNPRQLEAEGFAPAVLLEEVLVNGQVRETTAEPTEYRMVDFGIEEQGQRRRLEIPPGSRALEVHYTAISFRAPAKLRFRYMLEPLDDKWTEAGDRRIAYYPHLQVGTFNFRVSACNADGVWSEAGPSLAIIVRPQLWETRWFMACAGVAMIVALAGTVRLVERTRYRRRLAQLEMRHAVERERLRIAKDMHDDVGSILTQVSQLSDLGQNETQTAAPVHKHFERIGAQARNAVQALDEIVWATNPRNDNLPNFTEYICRFADECFETSRIRCWQEVPTHLPNHRLGADTRHNVFLAIKECFTNVMKHSGATEVWLRMRLENGGVSIGIEDNGRGFTPANIASNGNGLENMRARLTECHGRLELESQPANGTKVMMHFPLPQEQ
jgi:ligand-binding sensor domain-containing protein/signal transduction histidine kinase